MSNSEEDKSITESLFDRDHEFQKESTIVEQNKKYDEDALYTNKTIRLNASSCFEYKDKSHIILYIESIQNVDKTRYEARYSKCFLRLSIYPVIGRTSRVITSKEMCINSSIEMKMKFKIYVDINEIEERRILIQLFLKSIWDKDIFIGQTYVEIMTEPTFSEFQWYTFSDKPVTIFHFVSTLVYRGDLHIALKYAKSATINITSIDNLKPTNQILIWIIKAENLFSGQVNRLCNAFAKVQLLQLEPKRQPILKTKCIKNTCNPMWNIILKFNNIRRSALRQMGLEIIIYNKIYLCRKLFVGGLRLNLGPTSPKMATISWADSTSKEAIIWNQMLKRPNTWICGTLKLRPDML